MAKKIKLLTLIFMSALFILFGFFFLSGVDALKVFADNGESPHIHNTVRVYASEPTCDSSGIIRDCWYCEGCGQYFDAITGSELFTELQEEDPDDNLFYVDSFDWQYTSSDWSNMNDNPYGVRVSLSYDAETRIININGYVGQNMFIAVPSSYLNYVSEIGETYALIGEYISGGFYDSEPLSSQTSAGHASFALMMIPGIVDPGTIAYVYGAISDGQYVTLNDGVPLYYASGLSMENFSSLKRELKVPHLEVTHGFSKNTSTHLQYNTTSVNWGVYQEYSFCSDIDTEIGYFGIQLIRGDFFSNYSLRLDFVKLDDDTYSEYSSSLAGFFESEHGDHSNFEVMKSRRTNSSDIFYSEPIDVVSSALGHDFGDWTVTTAPTCLDNGVETRICSVCGTVETKDILALGHSFGDWAVTTAPTCLDNGVETRICSVCDAVDTKDILAEGHYWSQYTEVSPATCTQRVVYKHFCRNCGFEVQVPSGAPLGHEYEFVEEVSATESSTGLKAHYHCSRCDEYFNAEKEEVSSESLVIPKIGSSLPSDSSSGALEVSVGGGGGSSNLLPAAAGISLTVLLVVFVSAIISENKKTGKIKRRKR